LRDPARSQSYPVSGERVAGALNGDAVEGRVGGEVVGGGLV